MHDFLLAKEIVNEILAIVKEKNISSIKSVDVEIGTVVLAHDGFEEHAEDIDLGNLQFGLKNIAEKTMLKGTIFSIKKIEGDNWKIVNIKT